MTEETFKPLPIMCGCKSVCFMKANPHLFAMRICKELEGPLEPRTKVKNRMADIVIDYVSWISNYARLYHQKVHDPESGFLTCMNGVCINARDKMRELQEML